MRRRRRTVAIELDGVEVDAYEDETVLQAARRHGVDIPSLCYLDGVSVWGSCRLCVVQVADDPRLRPACAEPVAADMEVHVHTPRLDDHRRAIVEMLFSEGNHVCSVCVSNGACELQDMAVAVGMDHVRYDQLAPQRAVDASHPDYVHDPNRCVMCTRCVRVCDEIEGAHVWDVAHRGTDSQLVAELGRPWGESTSCTRCGKCVAVCPTGALFHQGHAVGEMRHHKDLIGWLAAARDDREWTDPEVPR